MIVLLVRPLGSCFLYLQHESPVECAIETGTRLDCLPDKRTHWQFVCSWLSASLTQSGRLSTVLSALVAAYRARPNCDAKAKAMATNSADLKLLLFDLGWRRVRANASPLSWRHQKRARRKPIVLFANNKTSCWLAKCNQRGRERERAPIGVATKAL